MCLSFGVGASLTWYFQGPVILWLLAPAQGQLSATGQPVFTGPTEMWALSVRLTMTGGLAVAVPVLAYQVARFLSPLLNAQQQRFMALFLLSAGACYLIGSAFSYYVLLPTGLNFLLHFNRDSAIPMIRITEYMDLALAMLLWLGVAFELPLAMFTLARLRLVGYQRFKGLRKYVPWAAFILSAILTPTPDVVNMLLVAVPLIVLFEVGVFLSWLARPRQRKLRQVGTATVVAKD